MCAASSSDTVSVLLQAAMCYIHIAALIAEYLKRKGKMTNLMREKKSRNQHVEIQLKINLLILDFITLGYILLSNINIHRYF